MPYIQLNDLNLYYEELGIGEPVLFLHSHFSRGILAFGAQIQPFQGKYRCLFPDFRGHGRTICKDLTWNSRRIADDMAAFLDALGIHRAHLVGYSCGAYVGLYLAAKYPEKVRSLVTIGGGAYPRPQGAEDFLPENLLARQEETVIRETEARHMDAHRGDWRTFLEQTVADWKTHPNLTEEEWRNITCPALFINGENDPFGTCGELKEKVPQAQTYEVKGGSHRPHFVMEQGREINARILGFIDGLPDEPGVKAQR